MPELMAPVEPQSTIRPSSIANSCEPSLSSWYCAVVSRLSNPAMVGPPGPRICVQVSPIEMPKSSVMRFDSSPETSHSVAGGTSAVRDQETVGSDSSSATHGSSMASVAGKKRAPTKQWANASVKGSAAKTSASAKARKHLGLPDMIVLLRRVQTLRPAQSGRDGSHSRRRRSRTMVFGLNAADENDVLRWRDGLACRKRRAGNFRRRRGHRGRQHQAADAAIADAVVAIGIAGGAGDSSPAMDA